MVLLHPNSEGFFCKFKGMRRKGIEGRIQKLYLAGTRTVARAMSRTHFYGSGIWVNVPKGRYNAFFHEQCDRRS